MSAHLPTRIAQAPFFARDPQELQLVRQAQEAEEKALRQRLAEGNRECAALRKRLLESEDELEVTAEATANAAERLEAHQGRQGLVLAAEAERCSAERAALEDELRRMEQLLFERDQEIVKLRREHEDLQASRLQGDLELTGLAISHEKASSEIRAYGAGVQELRDRLRGGRESLEHDGPTHSEVVRLEELRAELAAKQMERAELARRAEVVTREAQQLEAELAAMRDRVQIFERDLRIKQSQIEDDDHRLVREAASIRAQCDDLRRTLHQAQRDAAGIDQKAVLQERCGAEADGVRREVHTILQTVRGLASTLRARGLSVCSPEVSNDPVDVAMHVFLRTCQTPGPGMRPRAVPPVVWRLQAGEYLIDEDRVMCAEQHGHLVIRDPHSGAMVGIRDYMDREASRVRMDFAGAHGATH